MNEDFPYIVDGIFYTKQGPVHGTATAFGDKWRIVERNGKEYNRSVIYLDEARKVVAPKNDMERESYQETVLELIALYKKQLEELDNEKYKAISQSYAMEFAFASKLHTLYKKIYANYFRPNSLRFIFDD